MLLVTGGAGFIGSHVCDAFLADGWSVTALDDLSSGRRENVPVAVCGEMAADAGNVPLLLALGLRDFSVHPSNLLEVRKAVQSDELKAIWAQQGAEFPNFTQQQFAAHINTEVDKLARMLREIKS